MGIYETSTNIDHIDEAITQWSRVTPPVDASPMQILGRLHRLYLRYAAAINTTFQEFGINSASFDVLATLKRSGKPYTLTPSELAQSSLVTTAGITIRLDRLEASRLVRRTRDSSDRRVVHASLTPAGLSLVTKVSAIHFAREEAMLAGLSAHQRAELQRLLRELGYSFDQYESCPP